MTDTPSRPDPLAPDYGSPEAVTAGARPVAPDPTVDRFSAFDQPDGSTPPPAPTPAPTSAPAQKTGRRRSQNRSRPASSRPSPRRTSTPAAVSGTAPGPGTASSKPPRTARRKATITFTAVFVALVGIPMVLAAVIALVSNSSDRSSASGQEEREQVAFTPSSVEPSPVPTIAATVTSVRVEVQGPDRIADIRLYRSRDASDLENTALPFAATIPVDSDDTYLTVSADDFGYRGAQPMRCTIFVGDVAVSTSVGTKSVDCRVTDSTWQRER